MDDIQKKIREELLIVSNSFYAKKSDNQLFQIENRTGASLNDQQKEEQRKIKKEDRIYCLQNYYSTSVRRENHTLDSLAKKFNCSRAVVQKIVSNVFDDFTKEEYTKLINDWQNAWPDQRSYQTKNREIDFTKIGVSISKGKDKISEDVALIIYKESLAHPESRTKDGIRRLAKKYNITVSKLSLILKGQHHALRHIDIDQDLKNFKEKFKKSYILKSPSSLLLDDYDKCFPKYNYGSSKPPVPPSIVYECRFNTSIDVDSTGRPKITSTLKNKLNQPELDNIYDVYKQIYKSYFSWLTTDVGKTFEFQTLDECIKFLKTETNQPYVKNILIDPFGEPAIQCFWNKDVAGWLIEKVI